MAKLAWLGEPTSEDDGPNKNIWNGITFPRGVEVEVTDAYMIKKASRSPSFSVDGNVYVPPGGVAHPNAGPVTKDKTSYSEMKVAELRAIAAEKGVDVDGLSKSEIIEKLSA